MSTFCFRLLFHLGMAVASDQTEVNLQTTLCPNPLKLKASSKERLVDEEALDYVMAASAQNMDGAATLADYVAGYLTASHRDMPGRGCPLAALCCEMPRQSSGVRERFTNGLRGTIRQLGSRMGSALKQRQRDEEALAMVASLVGALVLARAVNDPKLSDDILRATKRRLEG